MNKTNISWTDLTWNAFSGCKEISSECAHCYAETLAENKRGTLAFKNGFDLTLRPHKMTEPAKVKDPTLIFTNSMSDPGFLLEKGETAYFDHFFDAVDATPRHRYQILTKRPEIILERLKRTGRRLSPSVWMGVTIGCQKSLYRLDVLKQFRDVGARVLFISAEPLLEDITASPACDLRGIDWVIGGGESGVHASDSKILDRRFLVERGDVAGRYGWIPRSDRIYYVTNLRDACAAAGAAYYFKQWGGPRPTSGGRLVDGVELNGMPLHVPGAMPENYVHVPKHPETPRRGRLPLVS